MSHPGALPRGTRLKNGAFAVGDVLGHGGFGITYKGGDMANRRYVAIKEFFPPGAIRRESQLVPSNTVPEQHRANIHEFLQEATVLARFQNPGIVRVLDAFEENNTAYMVMEFLEGPTLAQRLETRGALDEWDAIEIGTRLANALEAVHGAGLLHRDIKPENIILAQGGRAVLIDFGTARAFNSGQQQMTQIITPGYAPLEQYAAQAKRGPQSDIYALGATLYHALSGKRPVAATDRAADIALPRLQSLRPGLTPHVCEAITHALQMEIERRPASASVFAQMLQGRLSDPVNTIARPNLVSSPAPQPVKPATEGAADYNTSIVLFHTTFDRHSQAVRALAFAPNQHQLFSGGDDRLAHIWNWNTNALAAYFGAHNNSILCAKYSPDGAWIATGGRDAQVRLWDAHLARASEGRPEAITPNPLAVLTDCTGIVRSLSFCPTRRELVCGDMGSVTLWDANSGQIVARRANPCLALEYSPQGNIIATTGEINGVVYLLDAQTLRVQNQFPAHRSEVTGLAYSPDGSLLATSGRDNNVRVWQTSNYQLVWEQANVLAEDNCLAWSPDSRLLASSNRSLVLLWTAQGQLWRRYTKHSDRVQAITFSPFTQAPYRYVMATASRDRTINLCRIKCDQQP